MNISVISGLIYKTLSSVEGQKLTTIDISPLDGRIPTVSIGEMRLTGKSAARLRVEKGINSPVDRLEVILENFVSRQ